VQNFTINVMERWRSSLKWTGDPTQIVSSPPIPSVAYTDLNLSYTAKLLGGEMNWFFNVQNLFNKQPPPGAFIGANGSVGSFGGFVYGDDPLGAYFTLGVRYRH
jgi:iron complex outermembrane receptor protein